GLRGRPADDRLHLLGERLELLIAAAERIRRVDCRLPFDAAYLPERVGDRARRHRHEQDVGAGRVAAVAAELLHLVARIPPEPGEPAADVSSADHGDVHDSLQRRAVPYASRGWRTQ